MSLQTPDNTKKQQLKSLLLGGLLPVIIFTVIEDQYGVIYGLIAAMIFGCGEMIYEKIRYKKIATMTYIGNGLIIALGGISLFFQDGIWFKLQPAIFEFGFFVFLVGSYLIGKPFLKMMIQKQNPEAPEVIQNFMSGFTLRLGFFFLAQTGLAVWAAYSWTTTQWAALKSVGLFIMLALYMGVEFIFLRRKVTNTDKP